MMIHGPWNKLVHTRRRDAKWVILPSPYLYDDVINSLQGTLLIWELDEGDDDIFFRKYETESLDGDLMITRGE